MNCRPFLRTFGQSEIGPRIGGREPDITLPKTLHTDWGYLLTLPLSADEEKEASIFFNRPLFDEMIDIPDNHLEACGQAIVVLEHARSRRVNSSRLGVLLSEHPLLIQPECDDTFEDEEETIAYPYHKLGGAPFLRADELRHEVESISKKGFTHFCQLDYIVPHEIDWEGDWPFADGLFNLFHRYNSRKYEWLWLWQY